MNRHRAEPGDLYRLKDEYPPENIKIKSNSAKYILILDNNVIYDDSLVKCLLFPPDYHYNSPIATIRSIILEHYWDFIENDLERESSDVV